MDDAELCAERAAQEIERGGEKWAAERKLKDSDGNECDLAVMCMREPGWAANRIQALTAELAEQKRHLLADEERRKLTGDALFAEGELAALLNDVADTAVFFEKWAGNTESIAEKYKEEIGREVYRARARVMRDCVVKLRALLERHEAEPDAALKGAK